MNVTIRPCRATDCKALMALIKEIAVGYNVSPASINVNQEALQEAGFGARPQFDCHVAELPPGQKNKQGESIVGYVLSTVTYSTWRGPNRYVDNLYVQPEFRGWQIGKRLIVKVAEMAVSQGCDQLRMHVANWKPREMGFLARWGGEDLTVKEGWILFHIKEDALRRLAAESKF